MERIGIYIEPEEFDEFRKLAPGDSEFACDCEEFNDRHGRGDIVVTARLDGFVEYCSLMGKRPGFPALKAYAAKKANDTTKM